MQQLAKNKNGLLVLAFLITLLMVTFATATNQANAEVHTAQASASTQQASSVPPSCRYGTMKGKSGNNSFVSHMTTLNAGAYYYYDVSGGVDVNYDNSNSNIPERLQNIDIEDGVLIHSGNELSDAAIVNRVISYNNTNGTNVNKGGGIWIIGNEMERTIQGNTTATQFAQAYYRAYNLIKSTDSTAQVAPGAVVQITPARLAYLDQFVQAYNNLYGTNPPVDLWTIHAYTLPEADGSGNYTDAWGGYPVGLAFNANLAKWFSDEDGNKCNAQSISGPYNQYYCYSETDDIDIFVKQVVDMRTWMRTNGYQERPLIITEYSILAPEVDDDPGFGFKDELNKDFSYSRSAIYFEKTSAFLDNGTATLRDGSIVSGRNTSLGYKYDDYRLVQQWFWYANQVDNAFFGSSRLHKRDGSLSAVGSAFRARTTVGARTSNLVITSGSSVSTGAAVQSGSSTGNATAIVKFRDNGDIGDGSTTIVARVKNSAGTVIATKNVPGIRGCGTHEYQAVVTFPIPVGTSNYTMELVNGSSVQSVPVSAKGFTVTEQVYLPIVE